MEYLSSKKLAELVDDKDSPSIKFVIIRELFEFCGLCLLLLAGFWVVKAVAINIWNGALGLLPSIF